MSLSIGFVLVVTSYVFSSTINSQVVVKDRHFSRLNTSPHQLQQLLTKTDLPKIPSTATITQLKGITDDKAHLLRLFVAMTTSNGRLATQQLIGRNEIRGPGSSIYLDLDDELRTSVLQYSEGKHADESFARDVDLSERRHVDILWDVNRFVLDGPLLPDLIPQSGSDAEDNVGVNKASVLDWPDDALMSFLVADNPKKNSVWRRGQNKMAASTLAKKRTVFLFGRDDRAPISKSKQRRFPYNTVVRISTGCSGTLVTSRHVLTAAHCVHDGRNVHDLTNIKLYVPGRCVLSYHFRCFV